MTTTPRRTHTHRRTRTALAAAAALTALATATGLVSAAGLVAAATPAAAAVPVAVPAAERPSSGRFAGAHELGGPIKLTFARESGIGLHLSRYTVAGTLRCEGEPDIPFDYDRMQVTAKTSARVSGKTGRFVYRAATLEITGRFVSSTKVVGTVTAKASYCTQSSGFVARMR